MRPISKVAPGWWDYTTLDEQLLRDVALLTEKDLLQLSRPGFTVKFYETIESFYLAEALDYINAWRGATASNPTGICGPIGPTEQLPLVAMLVNDMELNLKNCHFWGMDEWVVDGKEVSSDHPLSFARADMELCFNKIRPDLRMPDDQIHFPVVDSIAEFTESFRQVSCKVIQGGQGEVKHWAFNDPPRREKQFTDAPPSPEEYRKQATRVVELHPMTIIQNARTSGGGVVSNVPTEALTVGPVETWLSERVSIWHGGVHDNPFGMRLTAFMISKGLADSSVPMSLLADHPDVTFHYYRPGIGSCNAEMH